MSLNSSNRDVLSLALSSSFRAERSTVGVSWEQVLIEAILDSSKEIELVAEIVCWVEEEGLESFDFVLGSLLYHKLGQIEVLGQLVGIFFSDLGSGGSNGMDQHKAWA